MVTLTLAAYLPALGSGFIWDDPEHFVSNPLMTAPGGLLKLWTDQPLYYPLTSTSFWLMRRLFDLNPFPYHLVTVLMHAINSVLLWRLSKRLGFAWPFLVGLIFAVHPVHVQSVAWVTELKNTQSGCFYLLALSFFARFLDSSSRKDYAFAFLCSLLAILSKTSTVILPLALLLMHLWRGGALDRSVVRRTAPFFGLSLFFGVLTVVLHRQHVSTIHDWDESLPQRILLASRALWFYAQKLTWPLTLIFVYPRWSLDSLRALWIVFPLGFAAMVFAILRNRGQAMGRVVLLGFAYFAASLLPILNFFKMFYARYAYVADHWQYLADMGTIPLLVSLAWWITTRSGLLSVSQPLKKVMKVSASALLLGGLMALAFNQCRDYRDTRTLWLNTLRKNPSCWIAHVNLGMEFASQGRVEQASYHFNQALKLRQDLPETYIGLAGIEVQLGRPDAAEQLLLKALDLQSDNAEAMTNLAGIDFGRGRMDSALRWARAALALRERDANAHILVGKILERLKRPGEAENAFLAALDIDPNNLSALITLGGIYGNQGDNARAVQTFERAVKLAPGNAWARYNLGIALIQSGETVEGQAELAEAERLNPNLRNEIDKQGLK